MEDKGVYKKNLLEKRIKKFEENLRNIKLRINKMQIKNEDMKIIKFMELLDLNN